MVELGIVLGHPSKAPIVVQKVDEDLISLDRVLWDHQDAHPVTSDGSVLQSGKEDLILCGLQLKALPGSALIPVW